MTEEYICRTHQKCYICSDCYCYRLCGGENKICSEFYPEDDDEILGKYIEDRRFEYRTEAFEIMDCGDDEYVENAEEWDKIEGGGQ